MPPHQYMTHLSVRSFEKGLADRGGGQEGIPPVPEIEASFLYPFSYAPLGEGGHIFGLGGHFGPEKKYLALPAPQKTRVPNLPQTPIRPLGPSSPGDPPRGIFNKIPIPPPPGASDSPFSLPEQKKKIYIRNVIKVENFLGSFWGACLSPTRSRQPLLGNEKCARSFFARTF